MRRPGALRPITRTLRCAVDARALDRFVADAPALYADAVPRHKDGTPYGMTRRQLAARLRGHVQGVGPDTDGMGWVDIEYRHSLLGAELVAAGLVCGSREYAACQAADPFSLPRELRARALSRSGHDFDDGASFPRAKAAIVTPCRALLRQFLRHRDAHAGCACGGIMAQMGRYYFGQSGMPAKEQRERVKALFNSLDMDGTLAAWRQRQGLAPGERPAAGMSIGIGQEGRFDFIAYVRAQQTGTCWLAARMPAMRAFVTAHLRERRDERRLRHPERTLMSYVLQEAEAVSRDAKLRYARLRGHTVHNLQHDGIVVSLSRGQPSAVATQMAEASSHALGYTQPVEVKPW